MKNNKNAKFKFAPAALAALLVTGIAYAPVPQKKAQAASGRVLHVMSWEDYIYDSSENSDPKPKMIRDFEDYYYEKTGERVTVEYSTQGTCENMYTELKMNPNYDLVCPSEYMILKMMNEGMLEKLDRTKQSKISGNTGVGIYDASVSPYISSLFKTLKLSPEATESVYDYACCYMWGTMGYVYNPEYVPESDAEHWSVVWNEKYKNKSTIKDSVRDSYILALGNAYSEELLGYAERFKNGDLKGNSEAYNALLTEVFNRVTPEALEITGKDLKNLKDLLFGYEVDSGKKDMAAGKIWINFAWSGDAVYAMDFAEDPEEVGNNTAELNYSVPVEGSNIFFDGWVMPKGADVELAQAFIDFLQTPSNAVQNMDFIGYTTSIATDEVLDYAVETYGLIRETTNEAGEKVYRTYVENEDEETELVDVDLKTEIVNGEELYYYESEDGERVDVYKVDLSYLFHLENGEPAIVYTDTLGRQFSAQYPDYDTVIRCTVMGFMNNSDLERLNVMWAEAKEGNSDFMLLAVGIVLGVFIIALLVYLAIDKGWFDRHGKKGYTLVSSEEIRI